MSSGVIVVENQSNKVITTTEDSVVVTGSTETEIVEVANPVIDFVQSNWLETDSLSDAFIQNKPDLFTEAEADSKYYLTSQVDTLLASKANSSEIPSSSDALPEGATNLYFTSAERVKLGNLDETPPPTTLTNLTDTPENYTGSAGKLLAVNEAADGVAFVDPSSGVLFDTEANILLSTPAESSVAVSTDTRHLFVFESGQWYKSNFATIAESPNPDIGAQQGSSRTGYGIDYITDKDISNIKIGSNVKNENRAVRTRLANSALNQYVLEIFSQGLWQTLLSGINITTDNSETPPDIEFTNFGFVLSLITGDSDAKDFNGLPVVQGMRTSMGAFQVPQIINGGEF